MHEDENKFGVRRAIRDYGNAVDTNSLVFVFLHQMWFFRFGAREFEESVAAEARIEWVWHVETDHRRYAQKQRMKKEWSFFF